MGSKLTTNEFIEKAAIRHNSKYSYSSTMYIGSQYKVIVTCPIHGDFEQVASMHLVGKGCKKCSYATKPSLQPMLEKDFIKKCHTKHNGKYDYSKIYYKGLNHPITIICPIHGEITQSAQTHLNGNGCSICKLDLQRKTVLLKASEKFLETAPIIHLNKYDYTFSNYKTAKDNIDIVCPIHGKFSTTPNIHLRGHGCPQCTKTGFDKSKPAILYYLKINGGQAYKIGITNRSIEERFSKSELQCIETIATKYYEIGQDAYDAEQQVLEDYKEFKYTGVDILLSGNTELFSKDVLSLSITSIEVNPSAN